ncbi:hypothetical protein BCR33DRAFT_713621, partial [Rhizoclosmatium globosum]
SPTSPTGSDKSGRVRVRLGMSGGDDEGEWRRVRVTLRSAECELVVSAADEDTVPTNQNQLDAKVFRIERVAACATLSSSGRQVETLKVFCANEPAPLLMRHRVNQKVVQWREAMEAALAKQTQLQQQTHSVSPIIPSLSPEFLLVLCVAHCINTVTPTTHAVPHRQRRQHPFSYHNVVKSLTDLVNDPALAPKSKPVPISPYSCPNTPESHSSLSSATSDEESEPDVDCQIDPSLPQPNIRFHLAQNVTIHKLKASLEKEKESKTALMRKLEASFEHVSYLSSLVTDLRVQNFELVQVSERWRMRAGIVGGNNLGEIGGHELKSQVDSLRSQVQEQQKTMQSMVPSDRVQEMIQEARREVGCLSGKVKEGVAVWKAEVDRLAEKRQMIPSEEVHDMIEEARREREEELKLEQRALEVIPPAVNPNPSDLELKYSSHNSLKVGYEKELNAHKVCADLTASSKDESLSRPPTGIPSLSRSNMHHQSSYTGSTYKVSDLEAILDHPFMGILHIDDDDRICWMEDEISFGSCVG